MIFPFKGIKIGFENVAQTVNKVSVLKLKTTRSLKSLGMLSQNRVVVNGLLGIQNWYELLAYIGFV